VSEPFGARLHFGANGAIDPSRGRLCLIHWDFCGDGALAGDKNPTFASGSYKYSLCGLRVFISAPSAAKKIVDRSRNLSLPSLGARLGLTTARRSFTNKR
jgi:hypothetical protein